METIENKPEAKEPVPVAIPGAAKGTPRPVEEKVVEPVKPRSTAASILEKHQARRAAIKPTPKPKPEVKPNA